MPSTDDWINTPMNTIEALIDFGSSSETNAKKVEDFYGQKFASRETLNWVPSLNDVPLHKLQPNTLVRFRCMIQDMFDPEFYHSNYEVKNKDTQSVGMHCGMYKDVAHCQQNEEILLDSMNNIMSDRQTLYCVPIPAETEWVKQSFAEESHLPATKTATASSRCKRPLMEEDGDLDTAMETVETMEHVVSDATSKRSCTNSNSEAAPSQAVSLNFPLPGETGPACLVKVYGKSESTFKVTDAVEFIGVLSTDPFMVNFPQERDEAEVLATGVPGSMFDESVQCTTPPSLVPRLHCVLSQPLKHSHPSYMEHSTVTDDPVLTEATSIRNELLTILQQALFGDREAAEYLLCHLMSSVYQRHETDPIGKLCLNLSQCPKDSTFTKHLYTLIENIVTKSFCLKMTVDNMNTLNFVPKKDNEKNRLTSGILQLSDHTHLVCDETCMQPGQLKLQGLYALENLIKWQKVSYDFTYSHHDFPANIPVLILSEGKSLLPSDILFPMITTTTSVNVEDTFKAIDQYLTPTLLSKIRAYLTLVVRIECKIPEDIQKYIEEDFVKMRSSNTKLKVEEFHQLLTLARYLTISRGLSSVSTELWECAKTMESKRVARTTNA